MLAVYSTIMGREKWTKNRSDRKAANDRPSKSRKSGGISHVLDDDIKSPRLPATPPPTRAICDLASKQNWSAALERCTTHPQDMSYSEVRGSLLHFALWAHRRSNFSNMDTLQQEKEADFHRFLEKIMSSKPDMISSVGSLGYTPLHIVCSKDSLRNTHIVEMILNRSVPPNAHELLQDIFYTERNIDIPLEVTRRVVAYLPNPALMKDSQGKTPLFLACQISKNIPRREKYCTDTLKSIVEMLVECAPLSKGIVDKTGRTPVEIVKKQKKLMELVDILS